MTVTGFPVGPANQAATQPDLLPAGNAFHDGPYVDEPSTETGDFFFPTDDPSTSFPSIGGIEEAAVAGVPEICSPDQQSSEKKDGEAKGSAQHTVNSMVVEFRQLQAPVAVSEAGAITGSTATGSGLTEAVDTPIPDGSGIPSATDAAVDPEEINAGAVRTKPSEQSARAKLTFALRVEQRGAQAAETRAVATATSAASDVPRSSPAAVGSHVLAKFQNSARHPASRGTGGAGKIRAVDGSLQPAPENSENLPGQPQWLQESAQPSEPVQGAGQPKTFPRNSKAVAEAKENTGATLSKRQSDSPTHRGVEPNQTTRADALASLVRESPGASRSGQGGAVGKPPSRPAAGAAALSDPSPAARPPVREILLRVPADDGATIDVRLLDRSGRLHVAVRTPAADLATALRHDVSQLVTRIDGQGYRTESFVPNTPPQAAGGSRDGHHGGSSASGHEQPGGDSSGGSHGHQDQPRQDRPNWVEELEGHEHSRGVNQQEVTTWLRALRI